MVPHVHETRSARQYPRPAHTEARVQPVQPLLVQKLHEDMLVQIENLPQQVSGFTEDFKQRNLHKPINTNEQVSLIEDDKATGDNKAQVITDDAGQVHEADISDANEVANEKTELEMNQDIIDNEEQVKVEILPPRDKDTIIKMQTYLEDLPAVRTTKLTTLSDKSIL